MDERGRGEMLRASRWIVQVLQLHNNALVLFHHVGEAQGRCGPSVELPLEADFTLLSPPRTNNQVTRRKIHETFSAAKNPILEEPDLK